MENQGNGNTQNPLVCSYIELYVYTVITLNTILLHA